MTKLNGTNYVAWSQKIEILLSRDEVWDVVDKKAPGSPDAAWIKKDNQARTIIVLTMEDDQLLHVKETSTAREIWLKLKDHHQRSRASNKVHLMTRLFNIKMPCKGVMESHITEMLTS